jgi:hypothetical protein
MKSNSENSELFRENIRLEEENDRLEKENFRLDCLLTETTWEVCGGSVQGGWV